MSTPEAAAKMEVGETIIRRAKRVIASGDSKLIAAVERGEVPVATAAKQVLPPFKY
jgi:hypothetical protein